MSKDATIWFIAILLVLGVTCLAWFYKYCSLALQFEALVYEKLRLQIELASVLAPASV
ncbi:hypothetical protein ACP3V3_19615 [Vibrio sp. PNB22_3_1]